VINISLYLTLRCTLVLSVDLSIVQKVAAKTLAIERECGSNNGEFRSPLRCIVKQWHWWCCSSLLFSGGRRNWGESRSAEEEDLQEVQFPRRWSRCSLGHVHGWTRQALHSTRPQKISTRFDPQTYGTNQEAP